MPWHRTLQALISLLLPARRRFFKCCCACCCGWCKPSKNPGMFIRGRGMTVSRVLVTLMAIAVVSSCIYGMTKVNPHLVAQGLSVVDSVKVRGLAPLVALAHLVACLLGACPTCLLVTSVLSAGSKAEGREIELTVSFAGVTLQDAQDNGLQDLHFAMTAVQKGRKLRCHPAGQSQ